MCKSLLVYFKFWKYYEDKLYRDRDHFLPLMNISISQARETTVNILRKRHAQVVSESAFVNLTRWVQ